MANNRRARKDAYIKQRGEKNKRFLMTAGMLLGLSAIGFYGLNSMLEKDKEELNQEIISSKKKLDEVSKEIEDLKNDYEMRNTDQFKEKVAKEKLGMVKKDESEKENRQDKPEANAENKAESTNSENNQQNPQAEQSQSQEDKKDTNDGR